MIRIFTVVLILIVAAPARQQNTRSSGVLSFFTTPIFWASDLICDTISGVCSCSYWRKNKEIHYTIQDLEEDEIHVQKHEAWVVDRAMMARYRRQKRDESK